MPRKLSDASAMISVANENDQSTSGVNRASDAGLDRQSDADPWACGD